METFVEFDAALPTSDTIAWTKMCQAWEANLKKSNPFETKKNGELAYI